MKIYRVEIRKIKSGRFVSEKAVRGTKKEVNEYLFPNLMRDEEATIKFETEEPDTNSLWEYEVAAFWNWNYEEIEYHITKMQAMEFAN